MRAVIVGIANHVRTAYSMIPFIYSGSKELAHCDKKCTTSGHCSYKQVKTKNGIEITLHIGKDELKFNFEDTSGHDLEYHMYRYYRQSENALKWHSIEQVIGIFEKLIIFLYNGTVAIGHTMFQQEIKTLITELLSIYKNGVVIMKQYQAMFCVVLKGEGKQRHQQHIYQIFYEGFGQISHIYSQISDIHEKLTDLQKALDEAVELEEYNESIIENLQTAVSCCINGIELLCECGRQYLQKRLEKPLNEEKQLNDVSARFPGDVEDVSFLFVAIERFQMLIELSEHTIQNIDMEIHKTVTEDMAKDTVRKTMSSISSQKLLFEYHRQQFRGMRVLQYLNIS